MIHFSGGEPGNHVARGCDEDKPGNLARCVTVEYARSFA
jgi:hypothetical protein